MNLRAIACVMAVLLPSAGLAAAEVSSAMTAAYVAIARLDDSPNFSWQTTTAVVVGSAPLVEGRHAKNGYTVIRVLGPRSSSITVGRDGRGVGKTDLGWLTPQQARRLRVIYESPPLRTPINDLSAMIETADRLAIAGGVISGIFDQAGAKRMFLALVERDGAIRRDRGGGPFFQHPAGDFTVWLSNGFVTKYEIHLEGLLTSGCFPSRTSWTITTEIAGVGTTKVVVPAEARMALDSIGRN